MLPLAEQSRKVQPVFFHKSVYIPKDLKVVAVPFILFTGDRAFSVFSGNLLYKNHHCPVPMFHQESVFYAIQLFLVPFSYVFLSV